MGTATFDFSGEVVLITGGSRGLGLEIAQAFGRLVLLLSLLLVGSNG